MATSVVDEISSVPPVGTRRAPRLAGLFPAATGRPVTRVGVVLAALGVVAATLTSLFRTTGTGPLQSVFEEDARDILTDALDTSAAKAIIDPLSGYYVIGPRLLGELATLFPISWAAAVLSISSAVVCALLALQVYLASGAHFTHRLTRLAVAAPMMFSPVAENFGSEIYNRPVCIHFFAMYALFWVYLWTPTSRAGRVGALVTVGMSALSTILAMGYLPLALARLVIRRDRHGAAMFALTAAGVALQFWGIASGDGKRIGEQRLDPVWALEQYAGWALPQSVLGWRASSGLTIADPLWNETLARHIGVVLIAWAVVLVVVAVAVLGSRAKLLKPRWLLAGALFAQSVGTLALEIMANGGISQRYLMAPCLLLLAALVTLLVPAPGAGRRHAVVPVAAFAVFLLVVGAVNYRWDNTYRNQAPVWSVQIDEAARMCGHDRNLQAVRVLGGPRTSHATVPCHELRDNPRCDEPGCAWLIPPADRPPTRD